MRNETPLDPRRTWFRDPAMVATFLALCASLGALAGSLLGRVV